MKPEIPKRLERAMGATVEVDVKERILKRALFVTRKIASDGGIVDPAGINIKFFTENPVVLMMHGRLDGFPVIGRSVSLKSNSLGMESETQFADTAMGRELAYLYGVNEKKEVYARGWSFGWDTSQMEIWTLEHAKSWLGSDYEEAAVPEWVKRTNEVWVAIKSTMNEYSAVALGADKAALSRAFGGGVRLAGELITDMDLHEATQMLAEVRKEQNAERSRIEKVEHDIQALRGEGASAAARGDSEAIVRELDAWLRALKS
jgi:hypothetical protein